MTSNAKTDSPPVEEKAPGFPIQIHLQKAVRLGEQGDAIKSLSMREPKAVDIRDLKASGQSFGDLLDAAGRLCDQPTELINELSVRDAAALLAALQKYVLDPFVQGGLAS